MRGVLFRSGNSAGVSIKTRSMGEMTPAQGDHVRAVNATGAYNCMCSVLQQMRGRGGGLIVNVSSIAGKRATPLGGAASPTTSPPPFVLPEAPPAALLIDATATLVQCEPP